MKKGKVYKKLFTLFVIVLLMCGCSVERTSNSSSTVTVTTTDDEGNTTETTTTTVDGVTTTDSITTSVDDPTGLRSGWREYFTAGAEGVSNDGYNIYMIMDDPSNISFAAIMITTSNDRELLDYVYGEVAVDDDGTRIVDVKDDISLPFELGESEYENCFEIYFKDGDAAVMELVDLDTIIDDMISIWEVTSV